MTDAERSLRFTCLDQAVRSANISATPDEIISRANAFFAFLNGRSTPARTTARKRKAKQKSRT